MAVQNGPLTPRPRAREAARACSRGTATSASASAPPFAGQQRARRRVGDDPARLHHQHAIGEQQRLGHVVGHHHRGQAQPIVQRADRACRAGRASPDRARRTARPSASASARSPARGRRRRAALPARQRIGHAASPSARGRSTRSSSSATRACTCFAPPARRSPIAIFSRDRHVREQADILEDIADPPPQHDARSVPIDRLAGDRHPARARLDQPVDRLEQRRLARSRGADQRDEAARIDRRGYRAHRGHGAGIALGDVIEDDRRFRGRMRWHRAMVRAMRLPSSNA